MTQGPRDARPPFTTTRPKWAAIGAAIAVTLGSGGLMSASASISSGARAVFVPITPCRLVDTRPPGDQVGPRSTPIAAGEVVTQQTTGVNGNCTIPIDAIAVSLNVTAVGGTAASFLTLFPADAAQPVAANLNWTAGAPPTPNKVDVGLSATGAFKVFNFAGTVNLVVDIAGYYADHNHDDRYFTKAETSSAISSGVAVGIAAAAGETVAVVNSGGTGFVKPPSQLTLGSTTFTTSKAGRLHITLHVVGSLTCATGAEYNAWLVVDGALVANSRRILLEVTAGPFDATVFPPLTLEGITTASVGPGPHSVAAQLACGSGAATGTSSNGTFSGFVTVFSP